jgi:hypothetical protein
MSAAHRRYLLLEQGVGAAAFNFVLNAVIAWLMFRGEEEVPLWGQQSIAGDTIGTSLLLPLLTCLIVTRIARGHMRAGRVAPLGWTRASHPALGWLPRGTLARGLVLGLVGLVVLAPLTILGLIAVEVAGLTVRQFVAFKGAFAAFEAAIVTPLIALWAIAEATGQEAPAAAVRARS